MKRYLSAVLLTFSLAAPLAMAQDQNSRRYYDKEHKDYHQWNVNEERNYSTFRTEKHVKSKDFAHARRTDQQQYWNWRHEHPDDSKR